MPKSPSVRNMQAVDLDRITEIEQVSFDAPWSKGMLKEVSELADGISLVLEIEGIVQGYAFARIFTDTIRVLHVINLAVDSPVRGHGFGQMMLSAVLEHGRDAGCRHSYLEVRTTNLAAIRLYRSAGFAIIHKREHYYKDGSPAYGMGAVIETAIKSSGK